MPTEAHEILVDDIRFDLIHYLRAIYPDVNGIPQVYGLVDNPLFAAIHGIEGRMPYHADVYICPPDNGGPIMVEIGNMEQGKWSAWVAHDSKPVRILRVEFTRRASFINARGTQFEQDILTGLAHIWCECA